MIHPKSTHCQHVTETNEHSSRPNCIHLYLNAAGSGDGFLEVQLKPEAFQAAADAAGFPVTMRMQEGYDHR
jgi:S-formylglutathione hydrolase FrmB